MSGAVYNVYGWNMLNWVVFPVVGLCFSCACRSGMSGRKRPQRDRSRHSKSEQKPNKTLTMRSVFRIHPSEGPDSAELAAGLVSTVRGRGSCGPNPRKIGNDHALRRHRLRPAFCPLRLLGDSVGACGRPGQCAHAGNRRRHPGGRAGLSRPPIHYNRHRWRRRLPARMVAAFSYGRDRLPDRRRSVRHGRFHRYACLSARQCPHGTSGV